MNPVDQDYISGAGEVRDQARAKYGISYPELCIELVSSLSRTAKSAGLYTLTHPLVTESLGRTYAALGEVIDSGEGDSLSISFQNDAWLFSGSIVPASSQESLNLAQIFKTHGIYGLTFEAGVRVSELAALCEFLGSGSRNLAPGAFEAYLDQKGVKRIHPEKARYVKDIGYSQPREQAAEAAAQSPAVKPRPAAVSPAPELTPRPAAPIPAHELQQPEAERWSQEDVPLIFDDVPEAAPLPTRQLPPKPEAVAQVQATAPRPAERAPEKAAVPERPPATETSSRQAGAGQDSTTGQGGGSGGGIGNTCVDSSGDSNASVTCVGQSSGIGEGEEPGEGEGSGQGNGPGRDGGAIQAPGTGQGGGAGSGKGPGTGSGQGGGDKPAVLAGMTLGSLLTNLVESAVKDPGERVQMYQDALKMMKEGMDRQVQRATQEMAAEKERVINTRTRTERVLAHVADGKVVVDKEGRILMMNSAAEEISGKRLFEVVGKHVSEYLNPEEHILTLSEDMDLTGGQVVSGNVSVAGDQKVGDALRRSMALLEDDEGRVVGAYMTLPEVTKFKQAQRMQDEFLSKVTHDLQSPLSSISSALEMLSETGSDKLTDDEKNFLAISVRNSQRLTEMIRGILDFSKLEAGKMPVHPEPCPLGTILDEAVEGLLPWARTRGIKLTLRAPAQPVMVMADHRRIVQVITNLVSNAIKSTPSGGAVMVAASRASAPDPCALIGVRDTGPGIPKSEMDRIFNRFEQLESAGSREGVGLGLSIVKEFVALHKGRIWAESTEGKGATFYFTLPLAG